MPKIYEVQNVEDAVTLASKFKREGKYDWFRGQIKDWPPHSSLYRAKANDESLAKIEDDFNLFISWINQKEELKYLLADGNHHQLEAILQHYGFPTNYIDFTTEPSIAGFFACDSVTPPQDGNSCIYCLSIDDLLSVYEFVNIVISRNEVKLEKVIVDVQNLWRLQAQQGVFLHANYNWEIDYPLDKIIFPYKGYPSYPTRDFIYPKHKSSLEILLDEFFDRQRSINNFRKFAPFFDVKALSPLPNGVQEKAFKNISELKILPSWEELRLEIWSEYKEEDYHSTTGQIQRLRLHPSYSEAEVKNAITFGVKQLLNSNASIRGKTIDWILEGSPGYLDVQKAASLLSLIWNGMRCLPYDNEEISIASGNLIYLFTKNIRDLNREEQLEVFSSLGGSSQRVSFSIKEGNGSTAFASKESLIKAYGINFSALLIETFKTNTDPKDLFRFIYNPRLMFDFNVFKHMFATEIIPSQIALYESYVIYNPTQITIFGNP
jgi:hypothetical protein